MELFKPPRKRLVKPRVLTVGETLEHTPAELKVLRELGILPAIAGGVVSAKVYGSFLLGLVSATAARRIDWDGDTIMLSLLTSSYTPAQDTDTYWGDTGISTNELAAGGGYTAKGAALTTSAPTYDAASNEVRMSATSPVAWTFTGTKAFRYGVIWKDTTVAGTSPLIAYIDYGAQSVTDSTFNSNIDATHGMVTLAAA